MTIPSEEDCQLLPVREPYQSGPHSWEHRSKPRHPLLRRALRGPAVIVLIVSLSCLGLALCLLLYDIIYVREKLALADSYHTVLTHLWPVGLPNRTDVWQNENSKALHALVTCAATDSCTVNQGSIVLLSSPHFAFSIAGRVSGEDIWAASVLDAIHDLGYTAIFTTNNDELASTYRQYPDLVKIIILEGESVRRCSSDPKCIKTVDHPLGIPAWKMFSFHFWTGPSNPLGSAWTLSPENYALIKPPSSSGDNYYLGYSIENTCLKLPVTSSEDRPLQAYILAKRAEYFYGEEYAWPGLVYDPSHIDVELVVGIADKKFPGNQGLPEGIIDLGHLNKTQFYHHLGRSRALVGIGLPFLSPSPYDALCMGVPFINPILRWDENDPENRTLWETQHDGLKFQQSPYVYHVKKGDVEGFWDALSIAVNTPIERYIVSDKTMQALRERVSQLIESDWKGKAEQLLDQRKKSGKGELFEL